MTKKTVGDALFYAYSQQTMRKISIISALMLTFLLQPGPAPAATASVEASVTKTETQTPAKPGLPVPRFVSLATDEVNLRTGPGTRYPIRLVLRKEGLPVEIIREFDIWRQVRDVDGDQGWVHKSMLSGRRGIVVRGKMQTVLQEPDTAARPVVRVEPGVIASLETCADAWCNLSVGGYQGWIERNKIWGVYPDETFKE